MSLNANIHFQVIKMVTLEFESRILIITKIFTLINVGVISILIKNGLMDLVQNMEYDIIQEI